MKRGDLVSALNIADSASRDFPDTMSEWHWRFRTLRAEILMLQGHHLDAIHLLDAEPPSFLRDSDVSAWRDLTLSAAYARLSQFDLARLHLAAAQKTIASSQHQLAGQLALRRGSIEFLAGETQKAYADYIATRDIAIRSGDLFLESAALGSLGLAATDLERYDQALDWNKQALDLAVRAGALNSIARIEGNVGWSYHELGDFPNALEQFHQAESDAAKAGLVSDRAYWLLSAGSVEFDLGNLNKAESDITQALALADALHDVPTVRECYENLVLIALRGGQFALARQRLVLAQQSVSPTPDVRRDQYDKLLGAELDFRENNFERAANVFGQLLADKSVYTSVRWEAQATLAQVLVAQKKDALAEKQFAAAISTIQGAQDAIRQEDFRLSFLSSSIRFYDEYVNFLVSRNRSIDALRVADRSRAQTLEHGLSLASRREDSFVPSVSMSPEEIARRQNTSLLFYWLGPTHSFLWVITSKNVALLPLPARGEIDAAAAAYRKSFLDLRDPIEAENVHGKKLYDVLVRPVEKLLPKNSRVVILPDGSLTGLNFETLIVNDPKPHYWIEDQTISIATSLALLARTRNGPPPQPPHLLFFGDAAPASKDFPRLADAGQEAAALQKHFSPDRMTFFLGNQATPPGYLTSKPGRYTFIHFATHGTASITRPLESAIVLSPDAGKPDTYKLYARDIIRQPLNAYLVSISACNGAGERVLAGEGLVGLSWAFLRAGAHNVVAGLWEVSTASAPRIFDDLYGGVTSGQDPATALRQAKLKLVHSKGPYHRPFYWAPFQLYSGS